MMTIPGLTDVDFKSIKFSLFNGVDTDEKDEQILRDIKNSDNTKSNYKNDNTENLPPRADGKNICNYLRGLRKNLAVANNIPFESEECSFEGDCAGTCEKCDQEAAYLRDELEKIPEQNQNFVIL